MNTSQTYDLLSIGAHPDDIEVGTGGVLIDLAKRGYRCGIVIMTQGEMGTGGTAEIRAQEVKDAARILGVDIVRTFDWGDTRLEDSYDKRLELAKVIRAARPKIILAPYPHVGHGRRQSHPDHVASGIIALNAANLAALKKIDVPGEAHLVTRIFHYFLPPQVYPNFVVDITPHFEQWIAALSAHRSQFLNPEKTRDYIEQLSAMARAFGLQARCKYGQGFYAVEPVLVKDVMMLVEGQEGV
jgi:bacillithiol biosynthesis deacetylase BshB1